MTRFDRSRRHSRADAAELAEQETDALDWNEDENDIFKPLTARSALRYQDTQPSVQGPSRRTFQVQPGAPPPVRRASRQQPEGKQTQALPRRRLHPLVFVGVGLCIMVAGWVVLTDVSTWLTNMQNHWQYGYPRTYQCDAVVGHQDSAAHPSHFIALNLNGQVEIIEFPGGDASHARIYTGITVVGDTPSLTPVTLSFEDVNGDGTLDMIVTVGTGRYVFLNQKGQFVRPQN
jgi:hypothetical protein